MTRLMGTFSTKTLMSSPPKVKCMSLSTIYNAAVLWGTGAHSICWYSEPWISQSDKKNYRSIFEKSEEINGFALSIRPETGQILLVFSSQIFFPCFLPLNALRQLTHYPWNQEQFAICLFIPTVYSFKWLWAELIAMWKVIWKTFKFEV